MGSFLGVVARRLPRGEGIIAPRSHCESCLRALRPAELVPIVSFLRQGGRCAGCGAPIARAHLAMELLATLVPAIALALLPWAGWPEIAQASVLGWTLLALAAIDLEHWLLPDALTLPLLAAGLAATWLATPSELADHLAAAATGWAGLAGFAALYRRLRGREGLGGGDAKLFAAGGAWVGLAALPLVLLVAAVLGLGFALLRHGRALGRTTAVPFGPPLCAGIWALELWRLAAGGWAPPA